MAPANFNDDAPEGSKYPAEYDLTVRSAVFAPDARYNNGESLLLQWEGEVSNVSDPDAEVPDWFSSISFPIGKGWKTTDGGRSVSHVETGQDKLFVKSSYAGKLIDACKSDFQIADLLNSRGGPFEASVWEGLTFRIGRKDFDFGSTIGVKTRSFPIRFVGESNSPKVSNGSTPSVAQQVASSEDVRAQLEEIIRTAPDFATAQRIAFSIPAVLEDNELLTSMMSEGELYAKVKANA